MFSKVLIDHNFYFLRKLLLSVKKYSQFPLKTFFTPNLKSIIYKNKAKQFPSPLMRQFVILPKTKKSFMLTDK